MTDDSAAWLHCSSGLNQGIGICLDIVSRRRNLTFTYAKSVDDDLDDCINWRSSSTTSAPQFVSTPIFLSDSRHEVASVSHLNTITTPIIHRRRTTPIPAATSTRAWCSARHAHIAGGHAAGRPRASSESTQTWRRRSSRVKQVFLPQHGASAVRPRYCRCQCPSPQGHLLSRQVCGDKDVRPQGHLPRQRQCLLQARPAPACTAVH